MGWGKGEATTPAPLTELHHAREGGGMYSLTI